MIRRAIPAHGRSMLGAAALVWVGAVGGLATGWWQPAVAAGCAAAVLGRRRVRLALALALVAGGAVSGSAAAARTEATLTAPLPATGTVDLVAEVIREPVTSPFGEQILARVRHGAPPLPAGLTIVIEPWEAMPVVARDVVAVGGRLRDRPGTLRNVAYRATVTGADVTVLSATSDPAFVVGNGLRSAVLDRLAQHDSGAAAALVAGFLVGETSGLTAAALDDLRRAGLTHFVAVSGSNVALFLAAWWLVAGPLGLGPRLRAVSGLAALVVFVVATRWEASVIRAATMAGLVLAGRLAGVPIDVWRALGGAVVALLLVSGQLAVDVGFQLSVAATCGVLIGIRLAGPARRGWVRTVLVATVGAQAAVLPLLLLHFGTVPLMSPLANLLAAPLVTAATALSAIGLVTGTAPVVALALAAARGVLAIAATAAGWPQLDLTGVVVVAGVALTATRRRLRRIMAGGLAAAAVAWMWPAAPPSVPTVTFLDVGQGDAIVVRDPGGRTMLVDGGRDPAVLRDALRRNGVARIDVVVATHGDADHVGGLAAVVPSRVDQLWYAGAQERGDMLEELLSVAGAAGVETRAVVGGDRAMLGLIAVDVIGPSRRYGAENDGSIVLWLTAGGASVLLTGDIEAVAQRELPRLRPDVLQVPHHGSATTDLRWLADTVGGVAIVSVGENTFGHPHHAVLDALAAMGTRVWSTHHDGDLTIELAAAPADASR